MMIMRTFQTFVALLFVTPFILNIDSHAQTLISDDADGDGIFNKEDVCPNIPAANTGIDESLFCGPGLIKVLDDHVFFGRGLSKYLMA